MNFSRFTVFGTSLVLGVLMVIQFRSYTTVQALVDRETTSTNLFAQIQMLKRTSEDLQKEVDDLEKQSQESSDAATAETKISEEIAKYELLTGTKAVTGPGIKITFAGQTDVSLFWLVDLINDLWSSGAEAIAINDIRLTNGTWGLTAISGHLLLNGTTLQMPIVVTGIGDATTMTATLNQTTGFIERFTTQYNKEAVVLETIESANMPAQ